MIVYVEENGEAHTIDQAHKLAIQINVLIDSGFGEQVRHFVKALTKVLNDIADVFLKAWKHIKEFASDFADMLLQPKKENYRHWQQREQRRKKQNILNMYIKNKFNGTRPTDHARFNRSRRKG